MQEAYPNLAPQFVDAAGILQVLPALEAGGVERGTVEIAQAIVRAGGRALVASCGGRLVAGLARGGARHANMPLDSKNPYRIYTNGLRLAELIDIERIDLVHARSRAPAWSALMAARRCGIPFLATWHGVYDENLPLKRLYNSVMVRGELVIAISHYIAGEIMWRHKVPAEKIRTIHRGADTEIFDPMRVTPERLARLQKLWRLPEGAPVILLPARLTRWKGAATLLAAAGSLPGEKPFIVLAGPRPRRPVFQRELEDQADRLGLGRVLRITGHCDDMAAAYLLADIVVHASEKPEPFGRAIVEAQAMGRIVVGTDQGGAAETIAPGVTGFAVPSKDPAALTEALSQALSMGSAARSQMGATARASVLANFTTAEMQRKTLAVYAEILGRPVGPGA
jgi:glycosyltransferase involved in cell wall biosynthesis